MPRKRRADVCISPDLLALVAADLIRDEGISLKLYRCTAGKATLGVGYNVQDRGVEFLEGVIGRPLVLRWGVNLLTRAEAIKVLHADIQRIAHNIRPELRCFDRLSLTRQRVVLNFVFNLGGPRARGFVKAKAALEAGDYLLCAYHMMESLWALQVGDGHGGRFDRAERLAYMMRTDTDRR